MNLEILTKRLKELEEVATTLATSFQQVTGHKTECQHWINELTTAAENKVSEGIASALPGAVQ